MSSAIPPATGLAEWFRRRARRAPDRPALSFDGQTWTYGELQARVQRLATQFDIGGVKAGDRVGYLGFNDPLLLVALFAATRIGAIFVPLNFRLTPHELETIVVDAGIHTLIVDDDHRAAIDGCRVKLSCAGYLKPGAVVEGWKSAEPGATEASAHGVSTPGVPSQPQDVAAILYTSGTTGRPKGVMLTHANLWANNLNWLLAVDYASSDVVLNCAPLFHVGGLCVTVLPTLLAGGHVVLQRSFVPDEYLAAIVRHGVTVSFAVPAMLLAATQHASFENTDLSTLRLMICGGAPVPEPLLRLFNGRGVPMSQGFGMTESASAITFLESDLAIDKLGSCGKSTLLSDIRLIDADGNEITEAGVKGEICMRGENVTPGYWNQPAASADALDAQDWFRSGDIGYCDAEGYLYVCDRLKDMIISGGENIYPAEVENVLYAHPAILEVSIVGAPDPRWGERAVAFVAFKPGQQLSLQDLQAFAAQRLARYKLPRELRQIDALPRNSNGKVLKAELRARCVEAA